MQSSPAPSKRPDPFVGKDIPSEFHSGVAFRLLRPLGEGGTARAYLALRRAPTGEAPAVVKIILPRVVLEAGDTAATAVRKEAVALGRLNERVPPTENVVRLMDTGKVVLDYAGKQIQLPWLALEYVEGGLEGTRLDQRIEYSLKETGYAFDLERAARAIQALADGLSEIHSVGVVHRDLTPGNVLCCGSADTEMFKISDFGIARPAGVSATFGDVMLGTPGYVSPEQAFGGPPVGPYSDVFSLAAVVFFLLTGEHYFDVRSPMAALAAARAKERRSVLESPTLPNDLRERQAACQAIDLALARATSPNPEGRPQEAQLFAASLLPWLGGSSPHSIRPSARWMGSIQRLQTSAPSDEATWTVRYPPGEDRIVLSASWNAAGHCLAATTRGMAYWDGSSWTHAPNEGLPAGAVRFVQRLRPISWLVGSEGAVLSEYSRDGVKALAQGPDRSVSFTAFSGDLDDLGVALGERRGGPPTLFCRIGSRWLKPLPVLQAAAITSLARLDDERWLVVGRGTDGCALAGIYSPLEWDIELLSAPPGRALLSCASRPEQQLAVAVGGEGSVMHLDRNGMQVQVINGTPDFSVVTTDVRGRLWAGSLGKLWTGRANEPWRCVWHDPRWQVPFVSILAEMGFIVAMTVDGAVLDGRAGGLGATVPA